MMTEPGAAPGRADLQRLVSEFTGSPLFGALPPGSLLVFDADLRYLDIGDSSLDDLGLYRRRMGGRTLFEVYPSHLVEKLEPLYRRALAGRELTTEVAFDDEVLELRFRPLRAESGTVLAGMCFLQNRSHRSARGTSQVPDAGDAEDSTNEGPAEFDAVSAASFQRAIFTASPDIISVYDLESRSVEWANRWITAELGYGAVDTAAWDDPDAVRMLSPLAATLVFEDDHAKMGAALSAARNATDDGVIHVEYRLRHQDGSLRWFSQRTAPLTRDDNGKVTRIVSVNRDVTQAKNSEATLLESEERFRQLADSVDVAFVLRSWTDPPQYLYVNPAFERIFGYNPLTMPGYSSDPFTSIHPDDVDHFTEHYWVPAMKGLTAQADYRILRPDGEERWVRSSVSPVRDAGGRLRRTASTTEDITMSRHVAAAMIAAEAAEKANRAKNEFLSRVSHELRTPLNAVLGFAQLLELDELSDDQHVAVRHIIRGGGLLVRLIDDVLDISKIEGDRLDMSLEMVPISRLLSETVDLMVPQADAAGVTLHYLTNDVIGRSVRADHRRLRQVVLNLLSNAIKYNKPGGRVDVTCAITGDTHLDIVVADTGRGIRSENLPRLFVPFDRLDAASSGIDGTGVGLALSQRLMLHMGGTLTATSQLGIGSEFTASLPLGADVEVPDDPATPESTGSTSTITPQTDTEVSRRTVLYIEDNSSNMELMERLIARRKGWDLLIAGHGALGIELAMSIVPDLVLLDLHLPDMDGVEVLRRISLRSDNSRTRVVVISADANPHQVTRLLDAGAQQYLTKPLNVDQLLDILDSAELSEDAGVTGAGVQ